MRRLFIGGLSHTISEKDLRDRFGKFGEVSDVEIITRQDEDGAPLKTFSYVNINISDSDYNRCVTVLNKSKWKGGTLQIELAKESFLHRLAEERQQAAEKVQTAKVDTLEKVAESLKAAGVENFHMKAAVPGTEIPGHKNWVVSKFGRVLPVLHLKKQGKDKVFKYDPSKHCHNIKKIDVEADLTSVSKLTWQMDGGNDEISKKRRGEFPPQKKKPAVDLNAVQNYLSALEKSARLRSLEANRRRGLSVRGYDPDGDSEDELKVLVAREELREAQITAMDEDDGNLEVVGDEFTVKANLVSKNEEEYDSADTDEILTQNKTPGKTQGQSEEPPELRSGPRLNKKTKEKRKIKEVPKLSSSEPSDSEPSDSESSSQSIDSDYEAMMGNCQRLEVSLADLENLVKNLNKGSADDSDEEATPPVTTPQSGPRIAPKKCEGINPEDILASLFAPGDEREKHTKVKKSSLPAFVGTKDLFGSTPSTSGSDLKREAEGTNSAITMKPKRLKLNSESVHQSSESSQKSVPKKKAKEVDLPTPETDSSGDEMETEEKPDSVSCRSAVSDQVNGGNESTCSSSSESEDVSLQAKSSTTPSGTSSGSSTSTEDQDGDESVLLEDTSSKKDHASGSKPVQPMIFDPVRQQQDNLKRLAAVEQRQKETEQQKKLIQGALAKVDSNDTKGKHIVFGSDEESDVDLEAPSTRKKTLFDDDDDESDEEVTSKQQPETQELKQNGGTTLFDGTDEEEEDAEEDDFRIKPQFEGRAGQKLMELQSRFGADPRFQMDAKFLEDDQEKQDDEEKTFQTAEQELDEEKKKNLAILQSVLNISIQPSSSSKAAAKGKTFRDVSALHYDPTQEAHAVFETKPDVAKKESKAERRKKRLEAEKLPEVSQEIFYDVTGDLKEAFGTAKEVQPERTEVSWDKEEKEEKNVLTEESLPSLTLSSNVEMEAETTGGFQFSFFGDSAEQEEPKTDEYHAETLRGAKVPWQVDPRFQDSSSEDEDEKEVEEEEKGKHKEELVSSTTTEVLTPAKKFFFVFEGDGRLKEGPAMFCRRDTLEDLRRVWEERRESFRLDYRRKHRDAKRRFRLSTKT